MKPCAYCGALTKLYHGGAPMCLECAALIDAGKPPKKPPEKEIGADELKTGTAGSQR